MEVKSVNVKSVNVKSYKKPKKRHRWLRILLISLGLVVVTAGVVVAIVMSKLTDNNYDSLYKNPNPAATPMETQQLAALATTTPVPTPSFDFEYNGKKYVKNENIVNLLFLGIDTTPYRRINMKGYRSDMIMVCAIDLETKKVTLISIPRDTYTTVNHVDEDTGEIKDAVQYKINCAYSWGGGAKKKSFDNALNCIQMFLERRCQLEQPLGFTLDIPLYMYASINIDGIQHVAASVGGVDVTLDDNIPGVGSEGQTVHLVYANAENYVMDRHNSDGGDLGRELHQQTFMVALAKKIKSMGAPSVILNLYGDLQRYVTTNLTADQMLDLAELLNHVDIDSIQMQRIPGEGHTERDYLNERTWFYFPDEAATLQILLDVYYTEVG